jgi:ferredoxin
MIGAGGGPGPRAAENGMTYIVDEACIKCKLMDCIEVCPVDCFYEGENMLVIHPDECIDCGVCEPECPVEAIHPDTDDGAESWVAMNLKYSEAWPNITRKGESPADEADWRDVANKFEKHFSESPGKGD